MPSLNELKSGNGRFTGTQVVAGDAALAGVGYSALSARVLARLFSVNFNVITDQAISLAASKYVIRKIVVANASISLTTAAGGLYTAAAKGGSAIVAAAQVYSALTASAKFLDLTLAAPGTTDALTAATLYFSLTTPQGAAATADLYIFGDVLL